MPSSAHNPSFKYNANSSSKQILTSKSSTKIIPIIDGGNSEDGTTLSKDQETKAALAMWERSRIPETPGECWTPNLIEMPQYIAKKLEALKTRILTCAEELMNEAWARKNVLLRGPIRMLANLRKQSVHRQTLHVLSFPQNPGALQGSDSNKSQCSQQFDKCTKEPENGKDRDKETNKEKEKRKWQIGVRSGYDIRSRLSTTTLLRNRQTLRQVDFFAFAPTEDKQLMLDNEVRMELASQLLQLAIGRKKKKEVGLVRENTELLSQVLKVDEVTTVYKV